jgi:hypothetical protein
MYKTPFALAQAVLSLLPLRVVFVVVSLLVSLRGWGSPLQASSYASNCRPLVEMFTSGGGGGGTRVTAPTRAHTHTHTHTHPNAHTHK